MAQLDISDFLANVAQEINDLQRNISSISSESTKNAILRFESILSNLLRLKDNLEEVHLQQFDSLLQSTQVYVSILKQKKEELQKSPNIYMLSKENVSGKGRPQFVIEKEMLRQLLSANFGAKDIAKIFGISRATVYNRFHKFGMSVRGTYAQISNSELDSKVENAVRNNRNLGYRSVRSRLDSNGIRVTYSQVRQSMSRVDPEGVALRFGNTIKRRVYKVAGPNALWHIDGHHKLIRWRFVVHGGIDGYSRLITYMKTATNNRSETVFNAFMEAVSNFGWPSRLRCDAGVENVKVAAKMIEKKGNNRGSVIIGKSVHNQRIERLWVDVFKGSLSVYYELFTLLERTGILDIYNEIHMFALHFTYKPIIQRSLNAFTSAFNRHPIRTENSRTPIQLWTNGMLTRVGNVELDLDVQPVNHEIQPAGDVNNHELQRLTTKVELEDIRCPLTEQAFRELSENIQPLRDSPDDLAVAVFKNVLEFCQRI